MTKRPAQCLSDPFEYKLSVFLIGDFYAGPGRLIDDIRIEKNWTVSRLHFRKSQYKSLELLEFRAATKVSVMAAAVVEECVQYQLCGNGESSMELLRVRPVIIPKLQLVYIVLVFAPAKVKENEALRARAVLQKARNRSECLQDALVRVLVLRPENGVPQKPAKRGYHRPQSPSQWVACKFR